MPPRRSLPTHKTLLPGFGLRLNYIPKKNDPDYVGELFPSALSTKAIRDNHIAQPMTTLRELTMLQLMNSITDKPEWHIKVNDETIAQKWKEEALAADRDVTQKMVDWCIDELRHKATLIPPAPAIPPPIFVYNGDVFKSDFAVSAELKAELQEATIAFEKKIPIKSKDWHPGSGKKVWDLVHPSLFPLVYGHTRVLADGEKSTLDNCIQSCGKGETAPIPPVKDTSEGVHKGFGYDADPGVKKPFSATFQWLPCEVDISGEEAKITSYINNLHPEEHQLYGIISKLITASIPLWELTLAPLRGFTERKQRISFTEAIYDPDPDSWSETEGPQQEEDEDEDDYYQRRNEWIEETREVVLPEPEGDFQPLPLPSKIDLKERFGSRGLQVIVKLANIELTPRNPKYNGGSWHVEGQLNEHIVATALYYYSSSNITTSTLAFRQQCNGEETININYPQDAHDWLEEIYGCEQEGPCVQELGEVDTREGRLLTFPNILQHRVGPFKLADPKKPGHRKIVALFLVDPNIRVISTAHVPCQRQDWWEATRSLADSEEEEDHVVGLHDADFPISLDEAKRLRLELMEERKAYVTIHGKYFEESATFSLCEH